MQPSLAAALRLDQNALPLEPGAPGFVEDVITGLRLKQKALPPKYFYDALGSRLFDEICELPEYYPTRTEMRILGEAAGRIADLAGKGAALVEFGAGSSVKVRVLLDALERPAAYVPVDISGSHLFAAADALKRDYPDVRIVPIEADFTKSVTLPDVTRGCRLVGFFPGSTIGNFTPEEAEAFMRQAGETLRPGAGFVVGVDLVKDEAILHDAYNDRAGVTAAFNLNLLNRINRELDGDFDLSAFRHCAFYDAIKGRVEMHIESLKPQIVHVAGDAFAFREGETIHTENSYKFSVAGFQALAVRAGWQPVECFTDADDLFSVHYLVR